MVEYLLKANPKEQAGKGGEIRRTENQSNDQSKFGGNEGQGEVKGEKILVKKWNV